MKRFWDIAASVAEPDGGHSIRLDGKPMRLPEGHVLRIGPAALAQAVAAEWQAAGRGKHGEIGAADTPLTPLAGTAQARIAPDPAATIEALAAYADSDLLCYRAEHPDALARRQAQAWQPWLDWAEARFGARLNVTAGIIHVEQPARSLSALRDAVAALDPYALAALGVGVPALGSLVLGLALADGALDPAQAHALGALEEMFQAEQWGEDDEAAERRARVAGDIALAARFIQLSRA